LRVLDPIARASEVLFGLIMALTFTGTLSAATAGREDIRELLVGMIGCNIAWGLVDAVMFVMSALAERGHNLVMIRAVRQADRREDAHAVIAASLPPIVAPLLTPDDYERIRQGVVALGTPPKTAWVTREELAGACGVFLLVFLSTFPVVIPFIVFKDVFLALRTSNAIAIVMMFMTGWWLARHGGYDPWRTGASVATLGVVLVAIAIALGG
jgi:VIT1/CCC1 family predicted Fe2+/Mn2+ transporter